MFFKENPVIAFILTFVLVLFFLFIIILLFETIRKILNRMQNGNNEIKNKEIIEAKLYQIIYSKNQISFKELSEYELCSDEYLEKYLSDMIEKEIIIFDNDLYSIKR